MPLIAGKTLTALRLQPPSPPPFPVPPSNRSLLSTIFSTLVPWRRAYPLTSFPLPSFPSVHFVIVAPPSRYHPSRLGHVCPW